MKEDFRSLAHKLRSEQFDGNLNTATQLRGELSSLETHLSEMMSESKREMRADITRGIRPIVAAIAALETSVVVQQDQIYLAAINSAGDNPRRSIDRVEYDVDEERRQRQSAGGKGDGGDRKLLSVLAQRVESLGIEGKRNNKVCLKLQSEYTGLINSKAEANALSFSLYASNEQARYIILYIKIYIYTFIVLYGDIRTAL
jgi:hypothetical protein